MPPKSVTKKGPPAPVGSSVEITAGLQVLLDDPAFTKRIAAGAPEIKALMSQIQRDHVTEENQTTCGPMIFALKRLHDTVSLFEAQGNLALLKERSESKS